MLESYYLTADVVPIILFFFYWFHSVMYAVECRTCDFKPP